MGQTPNNPLNILQGKNRENVLKPIRENLLKNIGLSFEELHKKYTDEWIFYQALKHSVATASMVCEALNIKQKNTCRYKRRYEENGQLAEVKKSKCPVTGFQAWFLTTDPEKFPSNDQLSLF